MAQQLDFIVAAVEGKCKQFVQATLWEQGSSGLSMYGVHTLRCTKHSNMGSYL